jgi:hypothetical protein
VLAPHAFRSPSLLLPLLPHKWCFVQQYLD